MYLRGLEGLVAKDETKARGWFEKAAAVDAEAQYCLGTFIFLLFFSFERIKYKITCLPFFL
jgi:hypothetical protein